mmetsp:Transcript_161469/g.392085  ORF Transcript_161469/g.392085 Transcript_161469/m.392085 type:complete len:305 (+) Transcript_161469:29-943(+)
MCIVLLLAGCAFPELALIMGRCLSTVAPSPQHWLPQAGALAGQARPSRRQAAPLPLPWLRLPLAAPGRQLPPGLLVEAKGLGCLPLKLRQVSPGRLEDLRRALEPLASAADAKRLEGLTLQLREHIPRSVPRGHRQLVQLLGVAPAVGVPIPLLGVVLEIPDGHGCATGVHRARHLCKGVPSLQACRILAPGGSLACPPLRDDAVPQFRLNHDIEAKLRRCQLARWRRGTSCGWFDAFDILSDPDDHVVLTCAPTFVLRRLVCCIGGEERSDDLFPVVLLDGPHLQGADLVDAEAQAVLGALVE